MLLGNWRPPNDVAEAAIRHHRYWNLSCPFEWGKYSCVHQGHPRHALDALREFAPRGCALADPRGEHGLARALAGGGRVIFTGFSVCRQVFIASACAAGGAVQLERGRGSQLGRRTATVTGRGAVSSAATTAW